MATYKPIQSFTTTGSQSVVTFSNIPQDYTDLVIISNVIWTEDAYINHMRFNGDSGNNYSYTRMTGDGTSAVSTRLSNINYAFGGWTGVNPTLNIVHIMNYSNSTKFKTSLVRTNIVTDRVAAYVNLWRNANAITSITLAHESGSNYSAGSTFSLYGIKSGAPQALGGDLVTTDGNFWYHTFRSTQTFTPLRPLTVDYLVVAGGAAGGSAFGGGGGAGGLLTGSGLNVLSQSYTVSVGAGGAGRAWDADVNGNNGSNSVFATITSTGGGGGGKYYGVAGNAGGSGGGGGGTLSGSVAGGAASPAGQGNAGGTGNINTLGSHVGGGGGGAGAAGGAGNATGNSSAGIGGAGVAVSISGSSVTYAGGGGGGARSTGGTATNGGAGGAGGGGTGGGAQNGSVPTSGTVNTGSGGGGYGYSDTSNSGNAGSGGSGIVIVRYPV